MLLAAVACFLFSYFAGYSIGLWGGPSVGEGWKAIRAGLIFALLLYFFGMLGLLTVIHAFFGPMDAYVLDEFGIRGRGLFNFHEYSWDEISSATANTFLQPIPRLRIHLKTKKAYFLIQTVHTDTRFCDLVEAVKNYVPVYKM